MNKVEKSVLLFCIVASTTTCVYAQLLQQSCNQFCRDTNLYCAFFPCANQYVRMLCRQSCGVCTRCSGESVPCETGGTCADKASPYVCARIKQQNSCHKSGQSCLKTCGFCRDCQLPPDDRCDPNCKDTDIKCPSWDVYCPRNSSFPDVADLCPKTCGACKPCRVPTEIPTRPVEQQRKLVAEDLPSVQRYNIENRAEFAAKENAELYDEME